MPYQTPAQQKAWLDNLMRKAGLNATEQNRVRRARATAAAKRSNQVIEQNRNRSPTVDPFSDEEEPNGNRFLVAMQQGIGQEGFVSRISQLTPLVAMSGRHQPRLQKAMLVGSAAEFAVYAGQRAWAWYRGREEHRAPDQYQIFMRGDSDMARRILEHVHDQPIGEDEHSLQAFAEQQWQRTDEDGKPIGPWRLDQHSDITERSLVTTVWYRADEETHALTLVLPSGAEVSVRTTYGKPGMEQREIRGEGGSYVMRDWTDYLVLTMRGDDVVAELREWISSLFPLIPNSRHVPSSDLYVYTSKTTGWEHRSREDHRPLTSVTLREGQADRILADINEFLASERDYREYGVTWRRGVLLYGDPGGGKTSFVRAMATSLGIDVYYLSLKTVTSNEALQDAVANVQGRSIIVLEDVDVVAPTREGQHSDDRVTLDVLLNVLDGMLTPHGAMFFMTTNDLSKLDSALVRPGRVDLRVHVVELDDYQANTMCQRFFGRDIGLPPITRKIMPAELADIFKRYLRDRESAVDEVRALLGTAE